MIKRVLIVLAVLLLVRSCVFEPFRMPSAFMMPTLHEGDYILVSKYPYGYGAYSGLVPLRWIPGRWGGSTPKRGDLVVFQAPYARGDVHLMRLIAFPGERVQMRKGRLYINGQLVPRQLLDAREDSNLSASGRLYAENLYQPGLFDTIGGQSPAAGQEALTETESSKRHVIFESSDETIADESILFHVSDDHYFVMGDSRDEAADSRFDLGFVPSENLIGRAEMVLYSLDYEGPAWAFWSWSGGLRWERFFKWL